MVSLSFFEGRGGPFFFRMAAPEPPRGVPEARKEPGLSASPVVFPVGTQYHNFTESE